MARFGKVPDEIPKGIPADAKVTIPGFENTIIRLTKKDKTACTFSLPEAFEGVADIDLVRAVETTIRETGGAWNGMGSIALAAETDLYVKLRSKFGPAPMGFTLHWVPEGRELGKNEIRIERL